MTEHASKADTIFELIKGEDTLIIIPPFFNIDNPSLGAHVLQSCAKEAGFSVKLFYTNLHLASEFGYSTYDAVCNGPVLSMVGERLFARAAHNLESLGGWAEEMFSQDKVIGVTKSALVNKQALIDRQEAPISLEQLHRLETITPKWVKKIAQQIARSNYKVVGAVSTYQQTNAAIAIFKEIKKIKPEIITIIGGANCAGSMAEGMSSLDPEQKSIDYIFSGESEASFIRFLQQVQNQTLPKSRIIKGTPNYHLDKLPIPDYTDFFHQLDSVFPDHQEFLDFKWLPYESSRGCWWGEKHHCTFCGLNGEDMGYRKKSPEKVVHELAILAKKHPDNKFLMADNIIPHSYYNDLLPKLTQHDTTFDIFYEAKANLTLEKVMALKEAGVNTIQPGIEGLSTALLKLMEKGVSARQNIRLLRYGRSVSLYLIWNILWGFPNDQLDDYTQTLSLIKLMRHLQPPSILCHVILDRFSPYFINPDAHGIKNLRPINTYGAVFPASADFDQVGYNYMGDYKSALYENKNVLLDLVQEVNGWKEQWHGQTKIVMLHITQAKEKYLLIDSRGVVDSQPIQLIDHEKALIALTPSPFVESEIVKWAVEQKLGVIVDDWYEPLATAPPELLQRFENQAKIRNRQYQIDKIDVR